MPIGEILTQTPAVPPPTGSKEREELNKKFKRYRDSCKAQGITPLAFDIWWDRGAPAVPALTKEPRPSLAEKANQKETRIDALGNIINPAEKTVQLTTGEVISMEQYINDVIQQLNEYNTATPEELADPLAQKDISTLQGILKSVGATPPKITTKATTIPEGKEPSLAIEDRKIIENQIRQEITSHPEKYNEWDAEDLINTAIYYRFDSGYPASDNVQAISAATGEVAPIAATAGISEETKLGLTRALQKSMPADESGNITISPSIMEEAERLLTENPSLTYGQIAAKIYPAAETSEPYKITDVQWFQKFKDAFKKLGLQEFQITPAMYADAKQRWASGIFKSEEDVVISILGQPEPEPSPEEPGTPKDFDITENGKTYRVFGTVDKSGKFTESNRLLADDTTPGNWYETGDLSQIKGVQSQEREPTEFDFLLSQGTPTWLKEFMSEKEYQQEQANTQAWQDWYSKVNTKNPANFVGQMSPEELASGRDIEGIGFNQQWAEDAYQGLIKNLTGQGTSGQNLPERESFMKEVAGTGIINTLNQNYNQRGWDTAMTQGTPLKNTAAQSPWWTRQWNLSAQDYNKLNPAERASYDKYTKLSGSNWWNSTKGKLGSSGTGITPAYQRR